MRAILTIFISSIFLPGHSKKQPIQMQIKGTLVIAAIASDGIVLAADSRISFFDDKITPKTQIAYWDSIQKIFLLNNYPIALSGDPIIGNKFFFNIVEEFNASYRVPPDIEKTINDFMFFVKRNYSQYFSAFMKNKIFCIGYVNNTPKVFMFSGTEGHVLHSGIGVSSQDALSFANSSGFREGLTCAELYPIIIKTIDSYTKSTNQQNTIGGPITIIRVKKDGSFEWVQNNFSAKSYKDLVDVLDQIKTDKLKINYLIPDSKERLIEILTRNLHQ